MTALERAHASIRHLVEEAAEDGREIQRLRTLIVRLEQMLSSPYLVDEHDDGRSIVWCDESNECVAESWERTDA